MQHLPPDNNKNKSLSIILGIILVFLLVLIVIFGTTLTSNEQPALPSPPVSCLVVGNVVKCNTTDLTIAAKYCPDSKIIANTYQLRNDDGRTTFICARKGDRDYND